MYWLVGFWYFFIFPVWLFCWNHLARWTITVLPPEKSKFTSSLLYLIIMSEGYVGCIFVPRLYDPCKWSHFWTSIFCKALGFTQEINLGIWIICYWIRVVLDFIQHPLWSQGEAIGHYIKMWLIRVAILCLMVVGLSLDDIYCWGHRAK